MHHDPASQEPHPLLYPRLHKSFLTHTRGLEVQPDHVRLRSSRQLASLVLPQSCNLPRPSVRSGQFAPEERLVDADARRGRDDAGLSQSATHPLSDVSCLLHKGPARDDDGPNRRPQAFAKAHGDAVETGAVLLQPTRSCCYSFPQPRTVQMHVDSRLLCTGPAGDFLAVLQRENGAREGVFEGDEARGAEVDVGGCDGVLLDIG